MSYEFRLAELDDVSPTVELIKRRMEWMDQKGIDQWNNSNYLECYPLSYFEQAVEKRELFVLECTETNKIVGAVVLNEYDEVWEEDGFSYYIHNLVTAMGYAGAGGELIRNCGAKAMEDGKKRLRLDCREKNDKLNSFYDQLGFDHIDVVEDACCRRAKREKRLADKKRWNEIM